MRKSQSKRWKALLEQHEMSQQELAEKSGLSKQAVSYTINMTLIEKCNAGTVHQIAKALGMSMDGLYDSIKGK